MSRVQFLKLSLIPLLWGGQFIAGRIVSADVPPFTAASLRFFFACIALLFLLFIYEKKLKPPTLRQLFLLLLLGLSGVFLYNVFFFSGLKLITGSRASIIVATTPSFVALASALLFKERFSLYKLVGIALALFGAAWAITDGRLVTIFRSGIGIGELTILGCVLSWGAYSLIGKVIMRDMSPLRAITYSCLIGWVALLIPAVAEGELPKALSSPSGLSYSLTVWLSIGYLGLMGTVVAFILYYQAIREIGPSKTVIFLNFVPIWAIFFGIVILGEKVTGSLILGAAFVIAGVYLTNKK